MSLLSLLALATSGMPGMPGMPAVDASCPRVDTVGSAAFNLTAWVRKTWCGSLVAHHQEFRSRC